MTQWLQRNGFAAKPALASAAKPYTDQGWAFVAVRIRPSAVDQALHGMLDPLQIHFATPEPVYPMRLSAMASEPETVRLYVLNDHRTSLNTALRGLSTTWAGRLSDQHVGSDLSKVAAGGPNYLTRFDGRLEPASITDDIHFAAAANDEDLGSTAGPYVGGGARKDSGSDAAVFAGIGIAVVLVAGLIWLGFRARRPARG